jgi:hydrogenase expression/formation protein HypE
MTEMIQLAHGGGGRLSRDLISREILTRFGNGPLRGLPDGATLPSPGETLVFTTDSFVVSPIEFPGGNIGHLAVHGTVNDLAVCGAAPKWLSLAMIMEEGLPLDVLCRVLDSVQAAASDCGVTIATGDTKVVARGQCDCLFLNTAGIGAHMADFNLNPASIREGDVVIVSGTLADHGMAVLAARDHIDIANGPESDTAPVHRLVASLQNVAESIRFMRDPTRGGAAAVLNEIVEGRDCGIMIREADLPFSVGTRAVSELLGLDPLHAASEGRVIAVCAPEAQESVQAAWRALPEGRDTTCIGRVTREAGAGRVVLETCTGGRRLVDVPRGELLPRIC